LVDLHVHTTESDGTVSPACLVADAVRMGLEAVGVCDHDTFSGYEAALPAAQAAGLDLVRGIELSTRMPVVDKPRGRSVHVLGYFLTTPPSAEFQEWLKGIQEGRRDRNRRLAAKLQSLGLKVTLKDAEALGRNLTGRPHFARVLLQKGYVPSLQAAFDMYLDESAKGYVDRDEPTVLEGVRRIRDAGGLPVLAHPVRVLRRKPDALEPFIEQLMNEGLAGIEVWHSEHSPKDVESFLGIAHRLGLGMTGGSDFHGEAKPGVHLGTGVNCNLAIPLEVLDRLRNSHNRG